MNTDDENRIPSGWVLVMTLLVLYMLLTLLVNAVFNSASTRSFWSSFWTSLGPIGQIIALAWKPCSSGSTSFEPFGRFLVKIGRSLVIPAGWNKNYVGCPDMSIF